MLTFHRVLELLFSSDNDFLGEPISRYLTDKRNFFLSITIVYLAMVHLGPKLISQPMKLKPWLIAWNLFITLFSIVGTVYTLPRTLDMYFGGFSEPSPTNPLYENGAMPGLHSAMCGWNRKVFFDGRVGVWLLLFTLSKIPEMIDTLFLVLQKKKVIFLHWYHHATVMLYCWHCYTSITPAGYTFATMNYFVHSIMYTYYLICACGYRKVVRPFASCITGLQILQMVVGVLIVSYLFVQVFILNAPCKADKYNVIYGLLMYVSYLVLFSHLFFTSYVKKSPSKSIKAMTPQTEVPSPLSTTPVLNKRRR